MSQQVETFLGAFADTLFQLSASLNPPRREDLAYIPLPEPLDRQMQAQNKSKGLLNGEGAAVGSCDSPGEEMPFS